MLNSVGFVERPLCSLSNGPQHRGFGLDWLLHGQGRGSVDSRGTEATTTSESVFGVAILIDRLFKGYQFFGQFVKVENPLGVDRECVCYHSSSRGVARFEP